jgi:hypothetical protein
LTEHEADPQAWRRQLEKAVKETGADSDTAVIKAARTLMALLDQPETWPASTQSP